MPISVTCPGCSAKMKAPEDAAGKKIKCPKCQAIITVPAQVAAAEFEVVEDEPAPPAKKPAVGTPAKPKAKAAVEVDEDEEEDDRPKKKPAKAVAEEEDEDDKPRKKRKAAVAEDDDDEDEDDQPKKKKKRAAESEGGTSMARNVIGGVVLLVLLGVAGAVYYEKFKDRKEAAALDAKPSDDTPAGPGPQRPAPGGPQGPGVGAPNSAALSKLQPRAKFKLSGTCRGVQLSADGKTLATAWQTPDYKGFVTVWDISGEPKALGEYTGHTFALSPSGKFLVTSGVIQPIVYEVSTKKVVAQLKYLFSHIFFRDDNTLVGTTRSYNFPSATKGQIFVWDVAKNADAGSFEVPDNRFQTALPANGGKEIWLVMSNNKFEVECYDAAGKTLLRTIKPENDQGRPFTSAGIWFSIAPDASLFAAQGSKMNIYDAATGKIVGGLPADINGTDTGFLPGGNLYLAHAFSKTPGLSDKDLVICDWKTQKKLATIATDAGKLLGIQAAVSGDGKTLVVATDTGEVQVFDISAVK